METIRLQPPVVVGRPTRGFRPKRKVIYPVTDGKPMAQSAKQWDMMVLIETNLAYLYASDENVWIGKDQFWYAVKGAPAIVTAPDVFVVFGRPNHEREIYQQWLEGNVAPQVVFEVLSRSNTKKEMTRKLAFYQRHDVKEYYVLDPHFKLIKGGFEAYLRNNSGELVLQNFEGEFRSPMMRVLFTVEGRRFGFFHPNGEAFLSPSQLRNMRETERRMRIEAEQFAEEERERAEEERERAEKESERAEEERQRAEKERVRAEEERERAEEERQRAEFYARLLRENGIEF